MRGGGVGWGVDGRGWGFCLVCIAKELVSR